MQSNSKPRAVGAGLCPAVILLSSGVGVREHKKFRPHDVLLRALQAHRVDAELQNVLAPRQAFAAERDLTLTVFTARHAERAVYFA